MLGILTNYKEWIFTKYDFQKEVEHRLEKTLGIKPVGLNLDSDVNPFQISIKYNIFLTKTKEENWINQDELSNIVKSIEWLALSD